jgi:hypothetical protein
MIRLQHTSVTGFPRCGLIAACHALRPIPPSSNRTCGFPASVFPENSRLGHSQEVARFERSQGHQPQMFKVLVHRLPFRRPKGPQAPSFEVCYQTKLKETVDLARVDLLALLGLALTSAASLPTFSFRWLHHRRLQPHADQFRNRTVRDPHLKACHQLVMGDRVKVSFQISVIHSHKPLFQIVPNTGKRLMRRASRTESERTVFEVRLKDRLQDQERGHLRNSIAHRGNTQRPRLSIGLWYIDPSHRLGTVGLATKRLLDLRQERIRAAVVFEDILNGYPIHSSRALVGSYQFPCRQQHIFPIYPIIKSIKPEIRLLLGLPAQFLPQSRELLRQLNALSQSGRWAFGCQILRSGTFVQAVLLLYCQKHVSGQAPWLHGHTPLPSYYGPVRLPTRATKGLFLPLGLPFTHNPLFTVSHIPRARSRCTLIASGYNLSTLTDVQEVGH